MCSNQPQRGYNITVGPGRLVGGWGESSSELTVYIILSRLCQPGDEYDKKHR